MFVPDQAATLVAVPVPMTAVPVAGIVKFQLSVAVNVRVLPAVIASDRVLAAEFVTVRTFAAGWTIVPAAMVFASDHAATLVAVPVPTTAVPVLGMVRLKSSVAVKVNVLALVTAKFVVPPAVPEK